MPQEVQLREATVAHIGSGLTHRRQPLANASSSQQRRASDTIPSAAPDRATWRQQLEELLERAAAPPELSARGAAESIDVWLRIARLHPDRTAQADCYRRVLALWPDEPRALEGLAGLHERVEDWQQVVRLLSKLADSLGESERRVELEHRVGRIMWQHLGDEQRAEAHFLHAFSLRGSHMPSVRALVQIYRGRGDWEDAAEILISSAARAVSLSLRLELLVEAACIHRDHLRSPRAAELLQSVLALDTGHLPAVEALADIYCHEQSWAQAVPLLEQAQRGGGLSSESRSQIRSHLKLARAAVNEQRRAKEDELEISIDLDEDLTSPELEIGSADCQEIVARARARLEENPRHAPSYRTLRAIFTDQGHHDQAWCVCATMTYLGCAAPRERLYYETYQPPRVGQRGELLTPEMWDRIVHPAVDQRVAVVVRAIGRELTLMHARPLRYHGLKPGDRRDIDNDQLALARALQRASTLLAVALPALYLEPDEPGELSLENIVHRGQLAPSLVARGNVLRGRSPRALAYIAGRTLAFLRPDFFLMVAVPEAAEFRSTWEAILELAGPLARADRAPDPATQRIRTRLEAALSSSARAELALAVSGSGLGFGGFDAVAWRQAAAVTAQRIGLISCGDPAVAARTLAEENAPGGSRRSAEPDQLLRYSVSEDYFAVRRHLGGTIDATPVSKRVRTAA